MANAARKYDERSDDASRAIDPLNPVPPLNDPAADPRFVPANDPRIAEMAAARSRGAGTGVLLAALVVVLAVIAYFLFAPGTPQTTVPADQPAVTSEPATPAPDATTTTPAPDATAPAAPAPDATAPADPAAPAPESSTPTETAPATPAPAEPAPAQ